MTARFVFVTDSHHYPDAPQDYGAPKMLTQSAAVLAAMAPAINALEPDFVVHGGDQLCGGGSFDLPRPTYLRSLEEAAAACRALKAPTYYIPGNHDCDAQSGSFDDFFHHFPAPKTLSAVDVAPRLRLILANPFHGDSLTQSAGVWTDQLDAELRREGARAVADNTALLFFIHSWILPDQEGCHGLVDGAERLVDTIDQTAAIAAVFTGHRHKNRLLYRRDYLVADTACLIGYPMGFRLVELDGDGWARFSFHQLDLPELIEASYQRSDQSTNQNWAGELHDRDNQVLLPRLQRLWAK